MKNKVAIVTGAAMGYKKGGPSIGGAIAIQLAKDGYKVIVADVLKMGQKTVEIIEKNGGEAIFVKANVTKTQEVKNVLKTAKEHDVKYPTPRCPSKDNQEGRLRDFFKF